MNEFWAPEKKLEQYCYDLLRQHIEAIDSDLAVSIYALSFYLDDNPGDDYKPTLWLGYNTEKQLDDCTPSSLNNSSNRKASGRNEAKWNYAFWLQNKLCAIGEEGTPSQAIRNEWIDWLLPQDDISKCFADLCVRVARQLHKTGVIRQKFSRDIPIIVHELEYYDQIAHERGESRRLS